MCHQVPADLRHGAHGATESLRPRLEQRILVIPGVELHAAVKGIDGRLDRVPDVVDLPGLERLDTSGSLRDRVDGRGVDLLKPGVWVVGRRGVTVDDPLHPPVDHRWIGVAVQGEPWSHTLDALTR